MSKIKQVSANLWVGPKDMGLTPKFMKTEHAIENYPKGESLIHDPLQPGNRKRALDYEGDSEAEDMGEFFEACSAGGARRLPRYAYKCSTQPRPRLLHHGYYRHLVLVVV